MMVFPAGRQTVPAGHCHADMTADMFNFFLESTILKNKNPMNKLCGDSLVLGMVWEWIQMVD